MWNAHAWKYSIWGARIIENQSCKKKGGIFSHFSTAVLQPPMAHLQTFDVTLVENYGSSQFHKFWWMYRAWGGTGGCIAEHVDCMCLCVMRTNLSKTSWSGAHASFSIVSCARLSKHTQAVRNGVMGILPVYNGSGDDLSLSPLFKNKSILIGLASLDLHSLVQECRGCPNMYSSSPRIPPIHNGVAYASHGFPDYNRYCSRYECLFFGK